MIKNKMKITTITAGIVLTLGLTLTGCGNDKDNVTTTTSPTTTSSASDNGDTNNASTSDKSAVGVSQAINIYYTTLISESSTSLTNAKEIENIVRDTTDDKTYTAFATQNDIFTAFDNLNDEQAKALADKIQALNPVADLFDYSDMTDKDRIVMNLLNIASSVMLNGDSGKEVTISVPEDVVTIDKDKATVPYAAMTFTVDGESQQMADVLGGNEINLTYVDNSWKVDGQKTFESIYNNAQPSDAGSE